MHCIACFQVIISFSILSLFNWDFSDIFFVHGFPGEYYTILPKNKTHTRLVVSSGKQNGKLKQRLYSSSTYPYLISLSFRESEHRGRRGHWLEVFANLYYLRYAALRQPFCPAIVSRSLQSVFFVLLEATITPINSERRSRKRSTCVRSWKFFFV